MGAGGHADPGKAVASRASGHALCCGCRACLLKRRPVNEDWGLKAALTSHGGKDSLQHAQQHSPAIMPLPLHARRPDVRGQQLTR